MPQMAEPVPATPEPTPNRLRWTRRQCAAIRDAGILTGRYELIDGEVISKMGHKPPHAIGIRRVMRCLARLFGVEHVMVQLTIDVAEISPEYDEPEPDVAVTAEPEDAYTTRHPTPADLLLVVEVADTTLRFDRTKKVALYSRAGIREYWIVDVAGRRLYVHRQPAAEGYGDVTVYRADEMVATLARPEAPIRVEDLLPPA
jgi:Uma2 family endonuclease